jgi:hypothetical protein
MPGLKFRVLLDSDHKDEVFRDVVISNESNFETFYQAIMSAFEFKGDQMASFYVSNDEWDKGHEINLMDMSYDDDALDAPSNVMNKAILKDFVEEPDQKFILVYDFMRMWIFLIELIGYEAESPKEAFTVLEVGKAPKENSKEALEEDFFASGGGSEIQGDGSEDDDYGFNDYDDDYNEEDFSDFNEFEY